jgi:polyisoprenoid-binding protein YceI
MTTLRSGESLRDSALRGEGLETRSFPTATFSLTSPIHVGSPPEEGTPVNSTATGDLTLHGVIRPVEIDLQAVLQAGRLLVVGSHDLDFADFDMEPPTGPASVLSVDDRGTLEVQLVFEKA